MARPAQARRRTPSTGWDPEDHPQSVLSGRTNDEVAANPDRVWTARRRAARRRRRVRRSPRRPPTSSPRSTRWARREPGRFQGRELALTNLDKVLFPPRGEERRRHQARSHPLLRVHRADAAPLPRASARSTCIAFPTASTARASGRSRRPSTRPTGSRAGATTTPTRARASCTSSPTARPRSRGSRTTPRSSCTRGRRGSPTSSARPTRSSTSIPARRRPGTS